MNNRDYKDWIKLREGSRDEFGDEKTVANIISKERLIEIRDNIDCALEKLSDELSNCNIPPVNYCNCSFVIEIFEFITRTVGEQLPVDFRLPIVQGVSSPVICSYIVFSLGLRRLRHCPFRVQTSVSAMLSQLPCSGV